MQPRQRPPGAADGIEVAAPALLQPVDLGKLGIDDVARFLEAAARGIDQPQTAKRKRRGIRQPAAPHIDQFQAAAAEIAGKAISRMNAGHDAERGKLGLPRARQHGDFLAENAFGLRDEIGTVLGFTRRRRGDDLDMRNAELIDQRAKAPKRPQRPLHRVGRELAGGGQRTAETAQHLLVEQRRRRPAGILVDDQPDGVRADIDDRNGGSIAF